MINVAYKEVREGVQENIYRQILIKYGIEAKVSGDVKDVIKNSYDGFIDGAMWGGIMGGGSKLASKGMQKLAQQGIGPNGLANVGKSIHLISHMHTI